MFQTLNEADDLLDLKVQMVEVRRLNVTEREPITNIYNCEG
jgi:hypothetical protein